MGRDPLDYLGVPDATALVKGKTRFATNAEAVAGTLTNVAMTPANVAAVALSGVNDWSESVKGVGKLATSALAVAGTNDDTAMTPLKVAEVFAEPPAIGSTTPAAGTFTGLVADSTGAITLDADAASNFSVAGAGIDLSLESAAGRVIVNGEEAAANAITLLSAAGGIDADAALQINIATSQNAANALVLEASAGGIDISASGAAAGEDIDIVSTGSSVNISASENAADAITLTASAGGIDVTAAGAAGEDLDLVCTSGSVNISGGEDAADAVVISAGAGGIDIAATGEAGQDIDISNTGGSVNITATEDNNGAIYIRANGGTSERIRLHADQGTAADSVLLDSDAGGITLSAALASDDAINLSASAGGVDIDGALQVNIASSENAADAISINASAGGLDMVAAGAAGEDIDITCTSGSMNLTSGEAIADSMVLSAGGGLDILAPSGGAGLDIDITNTGGSVNISASENAADAITMNASAGGIDMTAAGAAGEDIDITCTSGSVNISGGEDAADAVVISAGAGGIDISATGEAGQDIDISNTGGSVNISATEDVADAIYVRANGGTSETIRLHADQGTGEDSIHLESDAGGIHLEANGADITVTGTVKEIDAEFLYASGTDLVITQSPVMQSNANTGAAPSGTDTDVNLMYMQDGCIMECYNIGTKTIIAPRMDATAGLLISLDLTDNEGAEYNFGARNNAKHAYTIGSDAAFFMEAQVYAADLSGLEPFMLGFRKVAANNSDYTTYTDLYAIGLNNATSATNVAIFDNLNGAGVSITNTGDAWTGGDGGTVTLKILVSAAGVCTATIDGAAPSTPVAMTFDNADVVMPFIHFLHDTTTPGNIGLKTLKIGYQA